MDDNITNRQIAFLLLLTLLSYSAVDISRALATTAGYGSWLTIIVGSIIFAFIAVLVTYLNYIYQGKMIADYSKLLVGKVGSYVISIYYFLYFLLIVVFLGIEFSSILKFEFIPQTPKAATLIVGIPVFCFIAYKGVVTAGRLMEFIGIVYLIVGTSIHILMFTQGTPSNILPLFNSEDIGNYTRALKEIVFPFLGIEILLTIPLSKKNGKSVIPTVFFTIIAIGLFYVLIVEACIMKVGINDIAHYNSSLIVAIRDMELPFLDFLKRIDVMFLTVGFAGLFMGISIVYTAMLELLSKILPKIKRGKLIIIIGVVSYAGCLFFDKKQGFLDFVKEAGIYLGLVAVLIIPAILLIISKVKKHA